MKTTNFLIEAECNVPSNVIPLWPARRTPRDAGARPRGSWVDQAHTIETNAVELDPPEHRLARRVERVLCALLYHAVLEPGNNRSSKSFSIEKRVDQLVSHDRLIAIARAAISMDSTSDLTRIAAAAITFELQTQAQWRNRVLRLFSGQRRQIHADTTAIANLLAWDLDALKVRPIDTFAKFL
ncbi:hypothetical protein [Dyella sp.]|uniref:hypothetical protein n=1 Tax=Dyella sp. TaxID=1869338 RepID=UPI002B47ED3C|nr:hypothetical protein [Dyella sp.]HKT29858.1 hypothetical protein [Dyella sp.]